MTRIFLLLAALIAAYSHTALAAPPARVEIHFKIVTGSIKLGEGHHVLEHNGGRYRVVNDSTPTGIAALFIKDVESVSSGRVTESGLKPESYEENGRKGGRREARFDWPDMQLTMVYDGEKRVEPLPPDALDAASFPYSFAFVPPKAEVFTAHLTDGKRLTTYKYRLVARETLKTPMGDIETLHYEKVKEGDDKRGFDFWLAVDRYYLPVKLRYTEKDGRPFDSNVVDIRYQ